MRLSQLHVESFGGIRVVDAAPSPGVNCVEGNNGSGKSTLIAAVATLVNGKSALPAIPVYDGSAKAVVEGSFDDGTGLRVTMTAKGTYSLTMTDASGVKVGRPMDVLAKLRGSFGVDPLEVAEEEDPRDSILRALGVDVDEIDQREKRLREQRTDQGRERKRLEGLLATLPPVDEGAPSEEVSTSDLFRELQEAEEIHRSNTRTIDEFTRAGEEADSTRLTIKRLEDQLAAARQSLVGQEARVDDLAKNVASLVEPDRDAIRERMGSVDATNAAVRANAMRAKADADFREADGKWGALTTEIEACDADRAEALKGAGCTVTGLELVGDSVHLHGREWRAASTGQRLKAAIELRCASNPKLRVAWTRHGDVIDETNLALVRELCDEHGLQLFMERTGHRSAEGEALVIVDGEVAS